MAALDTETRVIEQRIVDEITAAFGEFLSPENNTRRVLFVDPRVIGMMLEDATKPAPVKPFWQQLNDQHRKAKR